MKYLLKVNILFLSLASILMGSDTRINALGGNAGFWPEDDQNIYLFPSTMNNFNLAQIQGLGGNDESGYYEDYYRSNSNQQQATFLWGEKSKYAFMMDGNDGLLNFGYASGSWGMLLGLDMDNSDDGTTKESSMDLGATFGLEMDSGELGLSYIMSSSDDGVSETDDPKGMGLGLSFRREQALWEFSHFLLNFSRITSEWGSATASDMALTTNLFRHWDLNSDTDLLFAMGFGYRSTTSNSGTEGASDNTVTAITLPTYTLAVETNLLDWATARVGVNNTHFLQNSTDNGTTKTSSMGDGDLSVSYGLGLEYGGFTLDIDLNPGFFTNPVSFITGNNLMQPLASQATMTFTW